MQARGGFERRGGKESRMTGAIAKLIWETAAEPARREAAKMRDGENGAACRYSAMIETLSQVRLALVAAVVREEDGVLSEIGRELAAMRNAVLEKKGTL